MEETGKKIIKVERGIYEKDGNEYHTHYIKGKVRGVDVQVAVVPPDNGGYRVLDIVYGDEKEAELVLIPYEIKDEKTGRVVSGNSYAVRTVDENGEIYECKVKPFRDSDKTLLNMLLRQ